MICWCVCLTACNVGDEGGFAPNIQNNEEGLSMNCEFCVDFSDIIICKASHVSWNRTIQISVEVHLLT